MLTSEESQENISSPSTVSSSHQSPNPISKSKLPPLNNIKIDQVFVKSLLKILSENKKSPNYFKNIKNSKDYHFTIPILPAISLLDYLRRILYYVKIEFSTLILAMIYIDRVCKKKVFLNEFNIHRIMIIAIYIAYTYNEDIIYDNNYLSLVSGMSKNEIVTLEEDFLELIEFNLFVKDEIYEQYKNCVLNDYFSIKDQFFS